MQPPAGAAEESRVTSRMPLSSGRTGSATRGSVRAQWEILGGCASGCSGRTLRSGSRRSRRWQRCGTGRRADRARTNRRDRDQGRLPRPAGRLGALHNRPRWARAFKLAPMTAQTKRWDPHRVGRTGISPLGATGAGGGGGVRLDGDIHNEEDTRQADPRGRHRDRPRRRRVIPHVVGVPFRPAGPKRSRSDAVPLCGAEVSSPRAR